MDEPQAPRDRDAGEAPLMRQLFNLRRGMATPGEIERGVLAGARLGGTNLWVLMFAIVIASVGLNVNSTAVIIGAMLISPLMGPLVAIGHGAAVQHWWLVRTALRTLGLFVAISLATSTLYFALSPLSQAHSELLARTSPTIWDVLIAFFGGAAGTVGLTRREPTTLVPGVAIATALMPPLCTAGYGLASGQPSFFIGAFYLFTINCVFIALGTVAICRLLGLPMHPSADEVARRRGRWWLLGVGLFTLLPSLVLAARLVEHEWFTSRAARFVADLRERETETIVVAHEVDPAARRIRITVVGGEGGSEGAAERQRAFAARLSDFGLGDAKLELRTPQPRAAPAPARDVASERLQAALQQLEERNQRVTALERERLEAEREAAAREAERGRLAEELRAQLDPGAAVRVTRDGDLTVVLVQSRRPLGAAERRRLERWLAVRLDGAGFELVAAPAGRP